MFLGVVMESFGQVTYTTDGIGGWIKTIINGGCTPDPGPNPPFPESASCQITININHPVTYANLTIGNNITINVNAGGILNISGDLTQTSQTTANISVNGGELNLAGELVVSQGQNDQGQTIGIKTTLNLNLRNSGKLNVTGKLDLKSHTIVEIAGDNSAFIEVGLIDLGQSAIINITQGGELISKGETDYAGNNSAINVW